MDPQMAFLRCVTPRNGVTQTNKTQKKEQASHFMLKVKKNSIKEIYSQYIKGPGHAHKGPVQVNSKIQKWNFEEEDPVKESNIKFLKNEHLPPEINGASHKLQKCPGDI